MKNKLLSTILIAALLFIVAGCAPSTGAPGSNTPAPEGQINVPPVDININSPAMSFQVAIPGVNPLLNTPDTQNRVAGVLIGIWHGIISPITLIVSFVNLDVQMYEVHNDGSPYNLGYLVGVALVFLLLGALVGSRR